MELVIEIAAALVVAWLAYRIIKAVGSVIIEGRLRK